MQAPARPAAARSKGATDGEDAIYLVEAQEVLNRWYDEFLYEGMTSRLEQMSATEEM